MTLRTGDGKGLEIDLELPLTHPALAELAFLQVRQHLNAALLDVLPGLLIAIGRVAEDPLGTQLFGLLVDQRVDLLATVGRGVPDLHWRDQRALLVGDLGVQLEAGKPLRL
jgi:hypothetical protein